ncbi:MAG TPA: tetratricopeptide repeat protein [Acidobacteriota bacterium]|nr:tetratricopeptide repeat protein [Acidobacteriota bacterium]
MKRMNHLAVLIVVISLFSFVSCNQFRAKVNVKQGNDLYASKSYEEAIAKYKNALELDPNLTIVWLNLGLSYMALYVPGSTQPKDAEYASQAIAAFREYLKSKPDDAKVNEYLITMYLNAERMDDAIQYFEDQMKKNPQDVETMQKLAFIYAKAGKFDDAFRWYQKRTEVEPNNPEAFYTVGVICWERVYKFLDIPQEEKVRLIDIGMKALDRATQLNPKYSEAFLYINLLYREKAKLISPDPTKVPDDKVAEYNGYLDKAKEYVEKAKALMEAKKSPQ